MNDKQKIETLKNCFEDTIWMAIRYADGRHTYAPSMVRMAIKDFQKVFPGWMPREDQTIKPPNKDDIGGISLSDDYLHDLYG